MMLLKFKMKNLFKINRKSEDTPRSDEIEGWDF